MKLEHIDNCVMIKFSPDKGEYAGLFDEENERIYISNRLGLLERECVYFHELSHKECYNKKCKCWDYDSNYLCEYHAMKGELQKVIARNSIRLSMAYLKNVKRALSKYKKDTKVWGKHLAAMTRLMKTKMFLGDW